MDRSDPTHHRGSSARNNNNNRTGSSLFRGSHNRPWMTDDAGAGAQGRGTGGGNGSSSRFSSNDSNFEDDLHQAPRHQSRRSGGGSGAPISPPSRSAGYQAVPGIGGDSYESPIQISPTAAAAARSPSPRSGGGGGGMSKSSSSPRLSSSSTHSSPPSNPPPVYGSSARNHQQGGLSTSSSHSHTTRSTTAVAPAPASTGTPSTFKTSMSTSSYERYRARLRQQEQEQQQAQQQQPAAPPSGSSSSARSRYEDHLQRSNSGNNLGSTTTAGGQQQSSLQRPSAVAPRQRSLPSSGGAAVPTPKNEMAAAMAAMKKASSAHHSQPPIPPPPSSPPPSSPRRHKKSSSSKGDKVSSSSSSTSSSRHKKSSSSGEKSGSSRHHKKSSSSSSTGNEVPTASSFVGSKQNTGSTRDMRKSRLAAEQRRNSAENDTELEAATADVASQSSSTSSSSNAAVMEQYLNRKNRSTSLPKSSSAQQQQPTRRASAESAGTSSTASASRAAAHLSSSTSDLPSSSSSSSRRPTRPPTSSSLRSSSGNNNHSSMNRNSTMNKSSGLPPATTTSNRPQVDKQQPPRDEMARTTDAAVKGWSTAETRNRRRSAAREAESEEANNKTASTSSSSSLPSSSLNAAAAKETSKPAASAAAAAGTSSKTATSTTAPATAAPIAASSGADSSSVGAYLAARQRRNASLRPHDAQQLDEKEGKAARTTAARSATAPPSVMTRAATPPASSSSLASRAQFRTTTSFDDDTENADHDVRAGPLVMTDDDDDDYENSASSSCSSSDMDDDADQPEWSVRVCVVSAVDFPANVVPNLPFSPILKVGVVHLPKNPTTAATEALAEATTSAQQDASTAIETSGLAAFPRARIRVTSSKVLSKRDNGSVEFHEEMRWDRVQNAKEAALAIELSARAVMTPSNIKESPVAQTVQSLVFPSSGNSIGRGSRGGERGGGPGDPATGKLGSLFRRGARKSASEMETANAAAVVAKHLVEGEDRKTSSDDSNEEDVAGPLFDSKATNTATAARMLAAGHQSEMDVKLRPRRRHKRPKMTEDIRLGSQIVPFTKLPLSKALKGKESARIEQWFELQTNAGSAPSRGGSPPRSTKRNPSILLEISFSAPEILDESEDDMDEVDELPPGAELKASFSRRASIKIRNQLKQEITPEEPKQKEEEPVLEPGVIDYVCVVGARDIGDQKEDDGSSGWVNCKPECALLEQFPPTADLHASNGRMTPLPDKVEWFCFPEGCRLWRGTTPPNADELNLKRFSASSPANIATTIASFDAWLGCTTSFSWFVLASNSDEYGSAQNKTVGACIRFYVPAPVGIDPTQDDFAQTLMGVGPTVQDGVAKKRLWVPIGICLVSSIPIVGAMEVMLVRLCESLATHGFCPNSSGQTLPARVYEELRSVIINYQRPIPGVVHCTIPFLEGDRLQIGFPSRSGLPPLPHGSSVVSVCRLIGADGVTFILAAMLTECKILLHSDDVANLCLVAEVMSALLFPFSWSLPYIPVLPFEMMEFIEAPLSYLLGVPSCNLRHVDPFALEDVVVIDLDKDFSSGEFREDMRSNGQKSKAPTPLPSTTANNISKAVYRLLRAEDELDDGSGSFSAQRTFPRLEPESTNEREFRIAVALEICGLARGYHACLAYASSSQPIFNVDKFLQTAPVLFDEQRGAAAAVSAVAALQGVSPRSRRFMSIFVNCQHFHQFIESIDSEEISFFHEIMTELNAFGAKKDPLAVKRVLSLDAQKTIDQLSSLLQRMDDKIPVYHVKEIEAGGKEGKDNSAAGSTAQFPIDVHSAAGSTAQFPIDLLQSIVLSSDSPGDVGSSTEAEGVKHLSVEYLVELEKNPWRYQALFASDLVEEEGTGCIPVAEKVKLREAIGERRYRAWKISLERGDGDDTSVLSEDNSKGSTALDLNTLLTYNADDATAATSESGSVEETPEQSSQRRIADAKDRDVLRRCLERARVSGGSNPEPLTENGRDLVAEAETSLRNPSARRFLLSVLSKRSQSESEGKDGSKGRRRGTLSGISKLDAGAFDVLVRLGCAMLDACMEDKDYDSTYSLLKLTAGLYCTIGEGDTASILYMTQRMGHHPIYADLGVWEKAKEMHLSARQEDNGKDESVEADEEYDEYEAAVATLYEMLGYGIPAEELARFASRVSEENGWFRSERGQSLLLLARRICIRRDQGEAQSSSKTSDIEMMSPATKGRKSVNSEKNDKTNQSTDTSHPPPPSTPPPIEDITASWVEIGWAHPAAQSSRRVGSEKVRRNSSPNMQSTVDDQDSGQKNSNYMKRSAITSMAYLGSSVVVTGGLDGGVFMARKVAAQETENEAGSTMDSSGVRGVHLDWGSSGSRYAVGSSSTSMDGEYGVGAVSCLAATRAANQSYHALVGPKSPEKDAVCALDDEELLDAMEGCRVVAGTTCGDLRVWSVKDVLSAVFYANRGGDFNAGAQSESRTFHRGGEGASSSTMSGRRKAATDFAAGSSLTRLKFSLRGRALSGHRGGVSCVDVPSNVYRPDSVISGGADGLIKLWSLRAPGSGRRSELDQGSLMTSKGAVDQLSPRTKAARSGDALSILSGHGGRILCVKTAWHGDRLLSGGADRTVRVWDLAGSGGKCLNSLSGHFGWVSSVQYWGPNTIISASTDRSIALWDARVRNSPLFTLRHHYAPISDVLVGSRTDPIMISAASDGTIAAWDFRHLSDENSQSERSKQRMCKVVRRPAATLYLHDFSSRRHVCGPALLSRGPSQHSKTVFCVGRDAVIREWDICTGEVVSEHATGHCDTISSFASFQGDQLYDTQLESTGSESVSGTITTSWDGTVRIRRQALR